MKVRTSLALLGMALLLISCDKKSVFDEYKSVGNAWHKDSIVSFDLPEMDPSKKYNLFLNVRDNNDFPFDNLFLIVSMEQPNHKVKVDTLEYKMANPDGTLMGDGFTDVKESKLYYKENYSFSQKGTYKVHIQQALRETGKVPGVERLKGITEVGFRVETTE
ncbi:gliding motility lipoprotein GldH [Flavobacterium sp. N1719]|uniref:gliding motility lipoprotein GldH n=1 Tax=Flavobacterium sp. N1719 TaxID=2885633 RepID=UPI0022215051|nr:gliding motility lipoprotein GldH [Flavobacterium sp. N1719]